jgi:hypothetical protein
MPLRALDRHVGRLFDPVRGVEMGFRIVPASAVLCLVAWPAFADIQDVIACTDTAEGPARLQCYDSAVAKLKSELAAEQARKRSLFGFALPSLGGSDEAAAAPEPKPVFGPREVTEIEAKVTDSVNDGAGHLILTLDNGEAWKVQDQTLFPNNAARKAGVIISKNLFGGFYLSVVGQQNNISVVRVR